MPTRIIQIPGFKGGQADSLYDPLHKQTFQSARNLDVFGEENVLTPKSVLSNIELPSGTDTSMNINDMLEASDGNYYIIGNITDTESRTQLYSTPISSFDTSPTWTLRSSFIASGQAPSALEEFEDGVYFNNSATLKKYGDVSGSPDTSDVSSGFTGQITRIRKNEGLGKLFIVHDSGKQIGSADTDTVTTNSLVLDESDAAMGIEPFGRFNFIGVNNASGSNKFLIWDGSATTIDDLIPIGGGELQSFRIEGNTIHYIVARDVLGEKLFRYYQLNAGGRVPKLIKEFKIGTISSGTNVADLDYNSVFLDEGIFKFGFNGETYSLLDQLVWAFGSGGKNFSNILIPHRTTLDGATTLKDFNVVKKFDVGEAIAWSDDNSESFLEMSGISGNKTIQGVYESNAFPLNPDFPGMPGKLKRIYLSHYPMPVACGFTLSVKHYGNYPEGGTVPSEDSFTDLETGEGASGASAGKTQSTDNTTFTEVNGKDTDGNAAFDTARFAQLRISFDEINSADAPRIIFPILLELEDGISRP